MATARDNIAITNTENYFKHAYGFNEKIREMLQKFREADDDEKHVLLEDITIFLKDLTKFTNKINITILERTYPKDAIEYATNLVEEFKRTIAYTEKFLIGKKFLDSSVYNLELLVEKSKFEKYDYMRYAKDEKDLAYKIGLIIADPRRISNYMQIISKISSGKMSIDEFKKLFDHIKGKLPEVQRQNESFVSFSKFKKNINHGVQN